jgi:hypothetical protein
VIDRRKIASVLLVLGALMTAFASFQTTYTTVYRGMGPDQSYTTSLWVVTVEPETGVPTSDPYFAVGWPVMITAVLVMAGVALMLRDRTAFVGRPLATAAAGALAGVVLTYVVQIRHEKERMTKWPSDYGQSYELNYYGGMYLLAAGAIIALAGAALAQQRSQPQVQDEDDDEDAVVVHQLDSDDDTPPFGIAIPPDEHQETR